MTDKHNNNEIARQIEHLVDRHETLHDKISDIYVVQGKQEVNLREHMRRTDLLEDKTDNIKRSLKPINTHVNQVEGVLKFIGLLALVSTIILTIYEVFFHT